MSNPLIARWIPHKPETWAFRYMTTKEPLTLRRWNQKHPVEKNEMVVVLPIGSRVKIVMVSRFGDVGLTDDLSAEHGYHVRVSFEDLDKKFENFSMEP